MTEKEILYYYPNRFASSRAYLKSINTKINSRNDLDKYINVVVNETVRESKNETERYFDQDTLQIRMVTEVENLYSYSKFKNCGSNIFSFSKELLEMFDKTDVENIEYQHIKHPYKEYYISFRDLNRSLLGEYMEYEHCIDGVYISTEIDNCIILLISGFNDNKKKNWWYYPDFTNINTLDFIQPNKNVKFALENLYDNLFKKYSDENPNLKPNLNRTFEEISRNIKLIINSILYLSTSKRDIKKEFPENLPQNLISKLKKAKTKHKIEVAETDIKRSGFSKINFVGKSFIRKNIKPEKGDVETHWRRGHWRNQLYGKDLLDNKFIWIEPTIVRADKGVPEKGHIYNIEKE